MKKLMIALTVLSIGVPAYAATAQEVTKTLPAQTTQTSRELVLYEPNPSPVEQAVVAYESSMSELLATYAPPIKPGEYERVSKERQLQRILGSL